MKKKYVIGITIILLSILLVGCTKNNAKKKAINSNWNLEVTESEIQFDEDLLEAFNSAKEKYSDQSIKPIALLAEQVVAGTNYMFLCKTVQNDVKEYKVAILYKDLEGKSEITKVTDFDVTEYINEDANVDNSVVVGGWTTNIPGKPIMLEEKIQNQFDQATDKLVGADYYPISVLAEDKDGNNFAILCYGRYSDANQTTGIFMLTLNTKETKPEISSIAQIDLKEFNK